MYVGVIHGKHIHTQIYFMEFTYMFQGMNCCLVMIVDEFCEVCLIPSEGRAIEPHPRDVADFISEVTVGERRGVSEARVTSLHFPVLCYDSLFDGRCLTGR